MKNIIKTFLLILLVGILMLINSALYGVVIGIIWKYVFVPCCGFVMLSFKQAFLLGIVITFFHVQLPANNNKKER